MIDLRIANYIKQSRALHIPDDAIVQSLLKVGWNMEQIQAALTYKDQPKSLIHVSDLYKEYKPSKNLTIPAIQGIPSLDIFEGEFVAITGQSGSGKSTFLNLIGLIDEPTSGDIFYNDQNTKVMNEKERTQLRRSVISFVFQFFNLLDNYTSLENIVFQLQLQKVKRGVAVKKALEILEFVNMKEKAALHPSELSGGEQQRVAIGRAVAKESQVILADEPTAHLDTANGENVIELLRNVNLKYNKTIVLVTHEPDYAKLADRTIIMADGRVSDIKQN